MVASRSPLVCGSAFKWVRDVRLPSRVSIYRYMHPSHLAPSPSLTHFRSSIAPSWSWASVEGPIQPWSTHYKIVQALVELKSIFTTPANGDPFGQISGGEIALTGKLFEVPRFRALAEADRTSFAAYAFSLDDYDDECLDNRTFYLPLVEAPKYTLYDDLDICGLLLQLAECDDERERVFQRVGFAVVAKVDGGIALADHRVDNWSPPPWSGDELEVVVIL